MVTSLPDHILLVPLLPFLAFVINIFCGRWLKQKSAWISIFASVIATMIALPIVWKVMQGGFFSHKWTWIPLGKTSLDFGYLLDPLAAVMLSMVVIVGTLIQIYSVGYMKGDVRYSRFFSYLSLFMSAMLTLVIADNYLLFFMSWEIMGLCSYLLIGFYFEKSSAANAGKKAFLTTRIGDIGFLLGILTIFLAFGTLNFSEITSTLGSMHGHKLSAEMFSLLSLAAFFIFCGTIGKSAQLPLHVWLPDAMEGPTPVSALIHAATMVAAGVFLIARSFDLFISIPNVSQMVIIIGTLTAFMSAFFALTATDIKKILAYSTISQLGYMVTALGLGGLSAGTFHLITHAFFKALLFLGAGSVIHGTGVKNIRELGGLFSKMKSTAITFLIASLALSGVPPLSGFWSKDNILVLAFDSGHYIVYIALLITAFLTAFYMFRLVFSTFFGKARNPKIRAHESPWTMTLPLWILAIGAVLLGLPGSPFMDHWIQGFIEPTHHSEHIINSFVMLSSIVSALGGILLAALFYLKNKEWPKILADSLKPLYKLSSRNFYFDEFYSAFIIKPFHGLGRFLFKFDEKIVDSIVNGTGKNTLFLSKVKNFIDVYIIDAAVNGAGHITQFLNSIIKRLQTGFIQNYLLIVFFAIVLLLFFEFKTL